MTTPEYHRSPQGWESETQDELNYLCAIQIWMWLQLRVGNVSQDDYELVQTHIHTQEEWVRKL